MFANRKDAENVVGGLSNPSKMPCSGYSLPASECKMGNLMSKNPNTICAKCYAKKGMYRFGNVKRALARRLESLKDPRWVSAMSYLIGGMEYFRWHDSGDVQDMNHFRMIVQVVKNTPNTLHWLPTREYGLVSEYVKTYGAFPENLIVRLSASKFNGVAPVALAESLGVYVSGASATDYNCRAPKQNNACGDCRMCWNKNVFQVNYKKH
jgi:hypothetical protein